MQVKVLLALVVGLVLGSFLEANIPDSARRWRA